MAQHLSLDQIIDKVRELQAAGKTVIHTHGVFDLIHPGIISHLEQSKAMGDVLVVTIIRDQHVRRGPGRPIFNESQRLHSVLSLGVVDYVCTVDDDPPFDCVKRIEPDIFARGQSAKERDARLHAKIFAEEREMYFGKAQIMETRGDCYSSSGLFASLADPFPPETKTYLQGIKAKYSFAHVRKALDDMKNLRVLLIGDTIIDEYHYCLPRGKSAKSPIVVNRYINEEVFAGGVAAIANHMAGLCGEVRLLTLLGAEDSRKKFLRENLKPNVRPHFFLREDASTVIKRRYINPHNNQKLFEINFFNDSPLPAALEAEIADGIAREAENYDLVIVSDFGHGLLTPATVKAVQSHAGKLAVNTQTNGANAGFNLITKYDAPAFVCLDESEARLALQEKHAAIENVVERLFTRVSPRGLVITLGKHGSIGMQEDIRAWAPVFSSNAVDTVGAGDAFFSYASLCFFSGMPMDLITFVGNAVGAKAIQIVGNKSSVEKYDLLEYVRALYGHDTMKDSRGMHA